MGVVAELAHELEIVTIALELFAGHTGLKRQSPGLFMDPPIIQVVPPFNLMRCRGGAPEEVLWEAESYFRIADHCVAATTTWDLERTIRTRLSVAARSGSGARMERCMATVYAARGPAQRRSDP